MTRRTMLKATGAGAAAASTGMGFTAAASPTSDIGVGSTSVEHAINPLGIDVRRPRLSWKLGSPGRNRAQSAYRVLVATRPDRLREGSTDVWDSGTVLSDQSVLVAYEGPRLAPRTRYYWTVRVWDSAGAPSEWSTPAWWETGLFESTNWVASWIAHDADAMTSQLRRVFQLDKGVAQARLYSTALGVYETEINGRRVGDHQLAPGWTDYHTRVQYQTYDVTELLRRGENAIGVRLGPGWYAGHVGMFGRHQYGDCPKVRIQLAIDHTDGTSTEVTSNGHWHSAVGPVRSSDLLMGEHYDAREETPGWSTSGFDATGWQPVLVDSEVRVDPVAQADPPVRVTQELPAIRVTEPQPGVFVYDLGQNMVGTVRLKVSGTAGQRVRLRHAEVLNPDGTVYTENLRTAKATDSYVLAGDEEEVYEPRFTFHGFRYVEVTGYPGRPPRDAVVGRVMHTDAPTTMAFTTDVTMLNQLHTNITWGQRGNFLSIPTDTPARDERLGWTGDINVFASTAAYNMHSARFLAKWMTDLRDCQTDAGAFPDIAPLVGDIGVGAAGWGDAGITVPWILYQRYGDRRVLEQNYPAMRRWISYLEQTSDGYLRPASGATYGDWLNVDAETRKDLIATAWFGYSAQEAQKVATTLGKDDEARRFRAVFDGVRRAFNDAFVASDGRLANDPEAGRGDTQAGYVLALSMDLLPGELRGPAAERLVELIRERDWHLSTGFLGTPQLLPTLTETGHVDVAYRLLTQRSYPSWGYEVDNGATTMWERWNSINPDGSFNDPAMNSFNHYAYGAVGEWMYQNIAGINPGSPGFQHIVIRPRPGGDIRRAEGRYTSEYGEIVSRWQLRDKGLTLEVTVPVNTTAEIWVPGRDATAEPQARFLRREEGCEVYTVGSGEWSFTAQS